MTVSIISETVAGPVDGGPTVSSITITDTGAVLSSYLAILGGGSNVINDGIIQGGGSGVAVNMAGGYLLNQLGGQITGGGGAVYLATNTSLSNDGTILGGGYGVSVRGRAVDNQTQGTIAGGTIGVGGYGTVTNAGTIEATAGGPFAVSFASNAANRVLVDPDAVFIGTVQGGGGTLEFASGAVAGTFTGLGTHYVNFSQLRVDGGTTWTAAAANRLTAGQTLSLVGDLAVAGGLTNAGVVSLIGDAELRVVGGSLTNQSGGQIAGPAPTAVYVNATGSLTNTGFISSAIYGVFSQGGAVTNAGTIYGHVGVQMNAAGTVTNTGVINSIYGVQLAAAGAIINAGTIDGSQFAVALGVGVAARLVVEPGAAFGGAVKGGGAGSTLEFASGVSAGTFSGLGARYVNFAEISVDSAAAWTASGSNTLAGGDVLTDAGTLTIENNLSGNGSISIGAGGVLALDGPLTVSPVIDGLSQGTLEVVQALVTIAGYGARQLTLSDGMVLSLPGGYAQSSFRVTNNDGNTYITACFATGTKIASALGRVPVEALRAGDLVCTARGRLAPVRWIGHRRTDLARHKRPLDVMPVRVGAGAFGPSLPSHDLVLSPDHAVFVDGRLIPIRYLINGVSIVQETRAAITYWHVELDRHDVILAENLPCESYLDTGNRDAFENAPGAVAMTPEFARADVARAVWAVEGCAPILTDPADPALRTLHLRLLGRARRAGDRGLEPYASTGPRNRAQA